MLALHPIQHQAPFWRALAADARIADFAVWFGWRGAAGYRTYDPQLAKSSSWDVDLLSGYRSEVLPNWSPKAAHGGVFSRINPRVVHRLLREKPDAVVVVGHGTITALLTLALCRATGIQTLLYGDYSAPTRTWLGPLRRRAVRLASMAAVIGARNRRLYENAGLRPAALVNVPFGVDNEHFAPSRGDSDGTAGGRPSVAVVGKMLPWKNHQLIMTALASLPTSDRPLLRLIGSGPLEAELRRCAEQSGLTGDLEWRGMVNYSRMSTEYGRCTAARLPSSREPWGLAVNEAMASHRAVIVSDACGRADEPVIADQTGVVFRSGDSASLAAAFRSVALEPGRWRAMGEKAGELISRYDVRVAAGTMVTAHWDAVKGQAEGLARN